VVAPAELREQLALAGRSRVMTYGDAGLSLLR
jgi:hypothetical protein